MKKIWKILLIILGIIVTCFALILLILLLIVGILHIHKKYKGYYMIENDVFCIYNHDDTLRFKLENIEYIITEDNDIFPSTLYIFTDDAENDEKGLYVFDLFSNNISELCKKKDIYKIMISFDMPKIYYLKTKELKIHLDKYVSIDETPKFITVKPSIFDDKYKQDGYKTNFQMFSDDYYYYIENIDKINTIKKLLNNYAYYFQNGYDIELFDVYCKDGKNEEIVSKDILYNNYFKSYYYVSSGDRKFDLKSKTQFVDKIENANDNKYKLFDKNNIYSHYNYINTNIVTSEFAKEDLKLSIWDGKVKYPDGFVEIAEYYGINLDGELYIDNEETEFLSNSEDIEVDISKENTVDEEESKNWTNFIKIDDIKELDYRYSLPIKSGKESTLFMYYPKLSFDGVEYEAYNKRIANSENEVNIENVNDIVNELNEILDKNRNTEFKDVLTNEMNYIDVKNFVYLTDINIDNVEKNIINIKYSGFLESDDVLESVKKIPISFMFSYNFDTKEIKFEKTNF